MADSMRNTHNRSFLIPTPLTSLVGRARESTGISMLLLREDVRLLTLTGTGGVGKTRLALAALQNARMSFMDGVCFVSLSALRDPELVLPTIVQALEEKQGHQPIFEFLSTLLRDRQMLLVLDNFEQVIAASQHIAALLAACPRLKFIVTSRERLRLADEYCWPVLPLSVPDLEEGVEGETFASHPAVALFVERAQAVQHDFRLTKDNWHTIAQICIQLDGLPLALELAAAHCKLLPPHALLARLSHRLQVLTTGRRDAPLRQQTLRNTLAWSYDLLSPEEQALFRRLCVFAGSCTVEALEALNSTSEVDHTSFIERLHSLLDKNLVQQEEAPGGESRLRVLETIREFGLECLEDCGELLPVRRAHVQYYLERAQDAGRALYGHEQAQMIQWFAQEQGNLREVMRFVREYHEWETALRLAVALGPFWMVWGYLAHFIHLHEGNRFLAWALANAHEQETGLYARALAFSGSITSMVGQPEEGVAACQNALQICRRIHDYSSLIFSLCQTAQVLNWQCDFRSANVNAEEAVELARAHPEACIEWGADWIPGYALFMAGISAQIQAQYERAQEQFQESLTLFTRAGNLFFALLVTLLLGRMGCRLRREESAREELEQMVQICKQFELYNLAAEASYTLGELAWRTGDPDQARQLLTESVQMHAKAEDKQGVAWSQILVARIELAEGKLDRANSLLDSSLKPGEKTYDREVKAEYLAALSVLRGLQGQAIWATRLLGCAVAEREAMGVVLPPTDQQEQEAWIKHLRTTLGVVRFERILMQGMGMTIEEVLLPPADIEEHNTLAEESLPTQAIVLGLTRRELEVLRQLAEGGTNMQIAERLGIHRVTVSSYLRSIYMKLAVSSRTAAVRAAYDHHLLKS